MSSGVRAFVFPEEEDMSTCTNCDRPVQARELCATHYNLAWRAQNAQRYTHTCQSCGSTFTTWRKQMSSCSLLCQRRVALTTARSRANTNRTRSRKPKPPLKTPEERAAISALQRSPIRSAFEAEDWVVFFAELKKRCDTDKGCWNWAGKLKDGYPVLKWDRGYQVHRLSLHAKHGIPLGTQAAHHICANTSCVNPDHLQPVTHRENVAEMLARNYYIARIDQLEAALAELKPNHDLLREVGIHIL